MRKILVCAIVALATAGTAVADNPVESLDGSGNNVNHPTWGKAGTPYLRVAAPNYADGIAKPVDGPNPRYISNEPGVGYRLLEAD